MDTLKVDSYSDGPDSLEKGCGPEAHPLHTDASHASSRQSIPTPRRSFVKHPWVIIGAVALTWFILSHGMRTFSQPRQVWHCQDADSTRVGHPRPPPPPPPPPPADTDVGDCVESADWTFYDQPPWASDYPYGAETTFSLPLDSDALSLISKGRFQQGSVNIVQSAEVTDTVDVQVRVAYRIDKIFELATVCQIEKTDREHGVGIFTPKLRHGMLNEGLENQLKFDVTLTLPAGATEGPLPVKKLETSMPNYSQNVADLQKSVSFDTLSLWSANGGLSIESVTSEVGQFTTLNGKIDGNFNALSSLALLSMNGRIEPTVHLLHRKGADPSLLSIHTMNGAIDAEVSLITDSSTGGEFDVEAESKNGQVGLRFADTPLDSILRCRAETAVGGVEVELDSAFEGTYSLQTLLGAKVVWERDVEDPSGKGRHRVVSQNKGFRNVDGEVKWVESDGSSAENEGHVLLKALVSSVKLVI